MRRRLWVQSIPSGSPSSRAKHIKHLCKSDWNSAASGSAWNLLSLPGHVGHVRWPHGHGHDSSHESWVEGGRLCQLPGAERAMIGG